MKKYWIIPFSIGFFAMGILASRVNLKIFTDPANTIKPPIEAQYQTALFDDIEKDPFSVNGQNVAISGRVYQDAGGYFWLVRKIGEKPYDSYALKLTAWPFTQSPPAETWSAEVKVSGSFSSRDSSSNIDILLGPKVIEIKQ